MTLNGSGSYDLDGHIVSYEWFEDGTPIATGETATLKLPVGSHTITLQVIDNQGALGEDQVIIEITDRRGDLPDNGGSGGPQTAMNMGVYDMIWSAKKNLDVTVNIRCDSNKDALLEVGDETVPEARVTLLLTHDSENDGIVENTWTLEGITDSSGNFRVKVPRAPSGFYRAEIRALTHDIHSWVQTLDVKNPDTFIK